MPPNTVLPTVRASWPLGLIALATALLLGGCGGGDDAKFAPPCPSLALLRDAADLTRYNDRGQDITDTLVTARIVAVPAACRSAGPGRVAATIEPTITLTRGPALKSRDVSVPYLVTVLDGEQIRDQQHYTLAGSFPPNVDQVTLAAPPINMLFPVTREKTAAAYRIFVSFTLSEAELAYNRQRGAH